MANRINQLSEWEYTESKLAWLLSQPFIATAEANEALMEAQISLVVQFCFIKTPNNHGAHDEPYLYKPVMIPMTITRGYVSAGKNPSLQEESLEILVPLITLMPLSPIVINDVNVQFSLDVTSQKSVTRRAQKLGSRKTTAKNKSGTPDDSDEEKGIEMHASLNSSMQRVNSNSNSNNNRNKANSDNQLPSSTGGSLHIRMNASSVPLPPGLGVIIDAYSNSIVPLKNPTEGGTRS